MKSKMRKIITVLLVALLMAPLASSFAGECGYPAQFEEDHEARRAKFAEKMDKLSEELNLTPEQRQQMKEHHQASREEMRSLREKMKENRKALAEELKKENPDRRNINRIASQMKEVQGEIIDQRIDNFLEMKKILTPEQYQKLSEIREKKRKEHKGKGRRKGSWGRF